MTNSCRVFLYNNFPHPIWEWRQDVSRRAIHKIAPNAEPLIVYMSATAFEQVVLKAGIKGAFMKPKNKNWNLSVIFWNIRVPLHHRKNMTCVQKKKKKKEKEKKKKKKRLNFCFRNHSTFEKKWRDDVVDHVRHL